MQHIVAELSEILKGLLLCGVLSMTGGFLTFGFASRYRLLLAPTCGLAAVAIGISFLYGFAHLSFLSAAAACVGFGCLATLSAIAINRPAPSELKRASIVLIVTSVATVLVICPAPRIANGPSIYIDASLDGPLYAAGADLSRTDDATSILFGERSSEARVWGTSVMIDEGRNGVIFLLAFAGSLLGIPSLYALDLLGAVIFAGALLGMAAALPLAGRNMLVLQMGLLACTWFDFIHNGFLGKIFAYPLALIISLLLLTSPINVSSLSALLLLTLAAVISHTGLSVGLMIATICIPYVAYEAVVQRRLLTDRAICLACCLMICAGAGGQFSHLVFMRPPPANVPGSLTLALPTMLDLRFFAGRNANALFWVLIAATVLIWSALLYLALRSRNVLATTFLGGPAITALAVSAALQGSIAYQLTGFMFPAIVVGSALLLEQHAKVVLPLLIVLIGLRGEAIFYRIGRDVLFTKPDKIFSLRWSDEIFATIGSEPAEFDAASYALAAVFRTEFARRMPRNIGWTPRGWRFAEMQTMISHEATPSNVSPTFVIRFPSDPPVDNARAALTLPSVVVYQRERN